MKTRFTFLSVLLALLVSTGAYAQCDMSGEDGQWPTSTIAVDAGGALTNISTNQYAGSEYSVVSGFVAGRSYEFTHAAGSYITVRIGSVAGTVLGSGFSPLTVVATSSDNLYVHWTVDAACTVDGTGSYLTTVQDVTPPCDMSGEDGQWPSSSVTVDAGGSVTTISSSQYTGSEYSVVTGMVAGNYYEVTHAAGSYVTVREGAVDGPVVAVGYSPLQFTATSSSDVYIHWTADENCTAVGTGNGLYVTTIQSLGLPPCDMSGEDGQWPTSAVTVDAGGALTNISTNQYAGSEYSVVTGISAGRSYEFTHANGSFITVRSGAVDGLVVGSGYSPLTVVAPSSDNLFVHWTTDDLCTVDGTGSFLTTVQDVTQPCDMSGEDGQWPTSTVTVDAGGAVTSISTNQYAGSEYSVVTGIVGGNYYNVTHAAGSYITVREGAVAGPVVASGYSPLGFEALSSADVYIHWTSDASCSVDGTGSFATTIQDLGLPPCDMSGEDGQWPTSAVTVDAGGAVTNISTNQYAGSEYSVVTGIVSGNQYEFTHAAGSYITVRVGAVDGAVLGSGYSPLTVLTTGSSDLYVHWTVDDACAVDGTGSFLTTVQSLGFPPCDMSSEDGQWPTSSVTVDAGGAVTNISTNQYVGSEYSVVTGVFSGSQYEFTHAAGSYITVRDGAVDGPVLGSGYSPLTITTTSMNDLFVHWTADDACSVDGTGSHLTTVQNLTPPVPCTTSADTWGDLNLAGGAPCFDGTNCVPTDANFTSFGVYGSETYLLDNVEAGYDYVFDMCTGVGAGAWIPEITIVAADGTTIDSWNGTAATGSSLTFLDQCSLEWTASQSGTYYIVINELGSAVGDAPSQVDCETSLAVDNGNPTVTCGTNPAICPLPPANDDCQGAVSLTVNATCVTTVGDVAAATESMVGCVGNADDDVWFSFQATAPTATVEVTGETGFDAVFEVFEGACGSLTSLECVDATGDAGLETADLTGLTPGAVYYVRVYDYYNASSATEFEICVHALPIGIESALEAGLSIYPNPSNGEFVVEVTGIEADAQIIVNDLAGRQVYSEGVTMNKTFRKEISLDVASGTYLLQVMTVDGTVTRRVQVN